MKMVLIDERTLDAKVVDCSPQKMSDFLRELMPEMDCPGIVTRVINGVEYSIMHDDEFLYHGYNFTGICENSYEILMGSLLISGIKDEEEEEDDDWGCRDLTDEECDAIIKAWRPIAPELAKDYAKTLEAPNLVFMSGSNALHYEA